MAKIFPVIGVWYQDTSSKQLFEIVALDEDNSAIEIQYEDGDIDEFELDTWGQLNLVVAAAPEDANAGYGASYAEPWEDNPNSINSGYGNPLETIEPEPFLGFDDSL
ncbi:DUF6763 family protein [Teredinibacter purpureus]|uniref:DUF6763 family protein n=1 Tax=Teredinibacter purpureus TaxID=2731756 RepID=UPI0005F85C20|nr:DUF6763 family protein [Teredinibacter purpureus]